MTYVIGVFLPRDRIELPTRGFSVLRGGKDSSGLGANQGGVVASTVAATLAEAPRKDQQTQLEALEIALNALDRGRLDLAREELAALLEQLKGGRKL